MKILLLGKNGQVGWQLQRALAPLGEVMAWGRAACDVADAAFAQRRKNIRNSMQSRYERALVDELLVACDIPATVRGETLGPEQYKEMGRTLLQIQGRDEPSML